jgi:hypothetical protein
MSTFKTYFGSVGGMRHDGPSQAKADQWDVVLFSGTYDPITRDEHEKIKKFVKEVVKTGKHSSKFSPTVEFGLICNEEKTSQTAILDKFKYNLTNEEKEFITAKIFGLRMFPLDFKDLILSLDEKEIYADKEENFKDSVNSLKKSFQRANILIVLNKDDFPDSNNATDDITKKFSDKDLNIGFITWKPQDTTPVEFLGNAKMSGQVIKAVCLMDFERPSPDQIKSFCYKYKLANILDLVRTIHFKVMGEKYLLAFRALFPDLVVFGDEEEDEKDVNYIFVMELLKKMYLRELYQNRVSDRQQMAQEEVSLDIGLKPKITSSAGGGGGGGMDAGSGGGSGGASSDAGGSESGSGGGTESDTGDQGSNSEDNSTTPEDNGKDEGF